MIIEIVADYLINQLIELEFDSFKSRIKPLMLNISSLSLDDSDHLQDQ